MKLRTKTAFAIAGIIIAFYVINLFIMAYLVYKTNQDYLESLLDERKRAFEEMLLDELNEIESCLRVFVTQIKMSGDLTEIQKIMEENHHLDGFLIVTGLDTKLISNENIESADLLGLANKLNKSTITGYKCGFERLKSLYVVCTYIDEDNNKYIIVDRIDDKFFLKTKSLVGVDVFYFSESFQPTHPLTRTIPVSKINGNITGYFVMGYSTLMTPGIMTNIEIGVVVFTISGFLLSTLGYILFEKDVLKRIQSIRDFMMKIKEHKFKSDEKINVGGEDEITELAESINSALNELEKSRNELEKALENLRVLNRVLRHDLLNDLTAIRGFAEIGGDECDTCRKIVDKTDKAVRTIRMLRDVENIIKESDLEKFRLSDVINTVMETYDVKFEIEGDAEVYADNGIYSIFDNLVNNSIKHGRSKKIRFEVRDEGDFVHVTVKDYGTGIPQESIDRIFDEGFSLAGSTGIGLYIVRRFMEKLRWKG